LNREEQMKTAQEFFDDFIHKAQLPLGSSVVLREKDPGNDGDTNWVVGAGGLSDDAYDRLVADMRKRYPSIDWSDIKEREGKWRIIIATKTA
jgi:hypothetical protein